MNLPVIYSPEARAEVDEAATWYEEQRAGLGLRFMARVDEAIERIRTLPWLHPTVHADLRRSPVRHFPYAVIYRTEPERVVIVAITHGRRDPTIWQRRA